MELLRTPLTTRPIHKGWESKLELYPSWQSRNIHDPDDQFQNCLVGTWTQTWTRTQSYGQELLLTLQKHYDNPNQEIGDDHTEIAGVSTWSFDINEDNVDYQFRTYFMARCAGTCYIELQVLYCQLNGAIMIMSSHALSFQVPEIRLG
jgi:hypothetical protein